MVISPCRNSHAKIIAAITMPGHLDFLRQAAKKQLKINMPTIPYSINILIHTAAKLPVYQA
jgi:hypothetical protein